MNIYSTLKEKPLTIVLLLTAWLSISLSSIIVLLSGEPAHICAFWRVTLTTLILLTYMLITRSWITGIPKRILLLSFISGLSLALHFLLWMTSLYLIPVSLSTTLVVTYPMISAIIEHTALKTSLSMGEVLGLLIAFLGVFIAMAPTTSNQALLLGSLLALGGAFLASIYFTVGRVLRTSNLNLLSYTTLSYGTASLVLLGYIAIGGSRLLPKSADSWSYMILLAIIPMLGGHTVMNYLLKKLKTHVVTSIALGEPAGASLLAALILAQYPSFNLIIGMILTVMGVWIVIRKGVK